jgi:hypothetical protein
MRELNINERLTAILAAASVIVGVASLAVAYQSYRVASDSTDIKAAIGNLSALATQTKRQADATHDQLTAIREQVGALRDQVAEAKHQTHAISEQTTAIKASAEAAARTAGAQIESARAQTRAADAAAAAQRPGIALTELTMSGFKKPVEKDGFLKGLVQVAFNYQYTNVGGAPWELVDNAMTISIEEKLPDKPDYSAAQHFPGNGLVIPKGQWMNLTGSPSIGVPQGKADAVNSGTARVFVFGIITYRVFGSDHQFCYAYEIPIRDGISQRYLTAGGPAYHCDA